MRERAGMVFSNRKELAMNKTFSTLGVGLSLGRTDVGGQVRSRRVSRRQYRLPTGVGIVPTVAPKIGAQLAKCLWGRAAWNYFSELWGPHNWQR
jgi:hypothetical protein